MPLRTFTRGQLLNAATTNPWTTDFRHLLPFPKKWLKRSRLGPVLKSVRPRDRIKYWNVAAGDQIRLLGDKSNTLHEVLSINRISNRVFVKGAANTREDGKLPPSKNYHYSRCQLFLGNYEFPPSKISAEPQTIPVFAQRLGTSNPIWNPFFRRFVWERFATRTVPVVPHLRGERIPIPWPRPEKPTYPEPTSYDTLKEEVAKVTYTPPSFTPSLKGVIPRPPTEDQYLTMLFNPHRKNKFSDSTPVEGYLFRELANPHSRAKKLVRWKIFQSIQKARRAEIESEELKSLDGRTTREAKAEAAWKWRREVDEEKAAQKKLRWKHTAAEAEMEKQQKRRARKEAKQRQRLTALVLKEEPNQVIPKDMLST